MEDDAQERRREPYTPGYPAGAEFWRYVLWIVLASVLIAFLFQPTGDPNRVDLRYSELLQAEEIQGIVGAPRTSGQENNADGSEGPARSATD